MSNSSAIDGGASRPAGAAAPWWNRYNRHFASGFSVLLIGPGLIALAVDRSPRTLLIAGLYIACMIWSAWRFRPSARVAATEDGSPEARLARLRAQLKTSRDWLKLFPLGLALAVLLKFSALSTAGLEVIGSRIVEHTRAGDPSLGGMLILLLVVLYFAFRTFRLSRELKRLEATMGAGSARAA